MTTKLTETEARSFVEPESPRVYNATMEPHLQTTLDILKKFEKAFAGTSKGAVASSDMLEKPQFLDIACGPGNFTLSTLLPRYMAHCRRIVAVDKAPAMIRFAKLHHEHEKINYQILDIVDGDVEGFVREHGLFARVFNFNMLHWVKDRARALKNIEKLMAPGGECFVVFRHWILTFEVIMAVAESERWQKHAKLLKDSIPAIAKSMDFSAMRQHLRDLLDDTNLTPLACEVLRLPTEGIPKLKGATGDTWDAAHFTDLDRIVSFNPIYPLVSNEEKEELYKFSAKFLSDRAQAIADGGIPNQRFAYVIHAYKPA